MIKRLSQIWVVMDRWSRRRLPFVVVAALTMAVLEAFGIGLIIPLIGSLTTDSSGQSPLSDFLPRDLTDFLNSLGLIKLAGLVCLLFVLRGLLAISLNWWLFRYANQAAARLSTRMMTVYLGRPYVDHVAENSADLIRNTDTSSRHAITIYLLPVVNMAIDGLSLIAVIAVLIAASPSATLIGIAALGIAIGIYAVLIRPITTKVGRDFHDIAGEAIKVTQQSLFGFSEYRINGRENHVLAEYRDVRFRYAKIFAAYSFLIALPRYYIELMVSTLVMGGLAIGLYYVDPSEIIAIVGLFAAALVRLLPGMARFIANANQLAMAAPAVDQVYGDFAKWPTTDPDMTATATDTSEPKTKSAAGTLVFQDVSFAYPGKSDQAVRDLSATIDSGQTVGIVGTSGAGKSTLLKLLLGLIEPDDGQISIDGLNIVDHDSGWRDHIGYVPQSVYILDESIARNVALGLPEEDIDRDRVRDALTAAHLAEFVETLPDGIDARLGDQGAQISGGQQQRIGLARAFYKNPSLLVLDEATSALDNETERLVIETIHELRGQMTVVVVAHRLSTVKDCDLILFMDKGHLAASGSFEELVEQNELFRRLVEIGRLT